MFKIFPHEVLLSLWGSDQTLRSLPLQILHGILGHGLDSYTLNWSDITPICHFITELDTITDVDLITKYREDYIIQLVLYNVPLRL